MYQIKICVVFSQYHQRQTKPTEELYSLNQMTRMFSSAARFCSWRLKKRFIQIFLATTLGQSPPNRSNVSSLNDKSGSGPVFLRTIITNLQTMPKLIPTRMSPVIEILQRAFSTEMVVVLHGMRRNIGASKLIISFMFTRDLYPLYLCVCRAGEEAHWDKRDGFFCISDHRCS